MEFSTQILSWYGQNKRDLPWRKTKDPYKIWLSEVILQQTKVEQGLPYYIEFINNFPTIEDLANANEDRVLKLWQGLGYYSRARNLLHTAKTIQNEMNSIFPSKYDQIIKLKGVGEYTAAAISSFAFSLPYAVVDGNVIRVLSRYFGIATEYDTLDGKHIFKEMANHLLTKENSSDYNQAIMEFGALQCKPKSPNCFNCILKSDCKGYLEHKVDYYPRKKHKIKIKNRYLNFFIIKQRKKIYIGKISSGIWKGLYEFPFLEFQSPLSKRKIINSLDWSEMFINSDSFSIEKISREIIHKLSHQRLYVRFWHMNTQNLLLKNYKLVSFNDFPKYPVSILIDKYISTVGLGSKN
ncbi:MAG: A/G-specific adenine glycosylase [Bacteroidota bacterium]|nr:A/G-specific adenine glycosylase [Bacteroidota bacterium]